ncbi:MAG: adenylate kinase [Clostridia bacterium]|nr:adenylate kinase [Clostridia bacterium]
MILLIHGASHTGKTKLAQRVLEEKGWPYLSIDHLKMGLIRSGNTDLTPMDDDKLTAYLWPIVREMVKTAIENRQNLVVEGGYIPFDWKKDFTQDYLQEIRSICIVFSPAYIETHFEDILAHGCDIEQRLDDSDLTKEWLLEDNRRCLLECQKHGCPYILIEDEYNIPLSSLGISAKGS